jgi:hypothetical protein
MRRPKEAMDFVKCEREFLLRPRNIAFLAEVCKRPPPPMCLASGLASGWCGPPHGLASNWWVRIRMFLGLPDPDPLVQVTDPAPDPSIKKQKK